MDEGRPGLDAISAGSEDVHMADYTIDQRELTFSQAAGIDPVPQPAKWGELPNSARSVLWSRLYHWINESRYENYDYMAVGEPWVTILYDYHVFVLIKPGDEFRDDLDVHLQSTKELLLSGDYNRVFDLLQFVIRHKMVPDGVEDSVRTTLQQCLCAYSLVPINGIQKIVQSSIPEQRTSIENALRVLEDGPFGGARRHLSASADCLNGGDYPGSVRESIHAVESVARRLDSSAPNSGVCPCFAIQERTRTSWCVQERNRKSVRLYKR